MDILPSCVQCNNPFTPRDRLQKYCPTCIEQSHICVDCGARKHRSTRGPRCKKCDEVHHIDMPNLKNRREEPPIEQVIAEVEAFGLLSEKQYAFGYVMGVMFGDGSISKEANRPSHIRSDGTRSLNTSIVYMVRLSVTSQAFAEHFGNQWEILTGRPAKLWATTRTNFSTSTLKGRREEYSVRLFNFRRSHILLGRYFSHLKYECDPTVLLDRPIEVTQGFIDGMVDSEGYVCERYIDIANKNIALLEVLAVMLERLGYSAKVYTSPSQSISHLRTVPYRVKYEEFD